MRKNMYVIAGGAGTDTASLLRQAIKETGIEKPSFVCIDTANSERAEHALRMDAMYLAAGAGNVKHLHLICLERGTEEIHKALRESDVIFLSGGEVEDGMKGIPGDVRVLLRQLYDMGKTFMSISAGTIMLGIAWPHWDDEDNHPEDALLFECLGFAPTIFDTHCEWEDWVELRKAVALSPEGFTGYGIPSGGMVVVHPDGSLHPSIPLDTYRSENGSAIYAGKTV